MTKHVVTDQDKKLTLVALMVVFLLGALDQTIVSTAMPRIIEQLHGIELYSWVTTTYMLTSTVMVPIYGKLSDLYGRKPILLIGIGIFLLGSVLCGLSGEFGDLPLLGSGIVQLVVFRALQGLGGAALFSSSFTIIADLFTPRERGKFMGLFSGIFAVAGVVGPLVGGFFTDHGTMTIAGTVIAGWRWVFYVNLPLGLFSIFLILTKMPELSHKESGRVDYLGAALFIVAVVPLLLALTWGGNAYAWDSARIVGLFVISAVALALFLVAEVKASNPLLPLSLFRNKVFSFANLTGFLTSMAFLGVVMFLPLFTQIVQGINATQSGLTMLPLMMGLLMSASGCGFLASRTGHYKSFLLIGMVVLIAGLVWLWDIGTATTPLELSLRMFMVGLGLGPSQSLLNIAVQNAVPITQIGIATSSSQFFRQMGSVVGLSIFGTLLTHNLMTEIPKHVPPMPGIARHSVDLGQMQSQAMDPGQLRRDIEGAMDRQYQRLERAVADPATKDEVLKDPATPEAIKNLMADGAGSLPAMREALSKQGEQLIATISGGMKAAFALSITGMFGTALWIIIAAAGLACFIPVLPLRNSSPAQERARAAAAAAAE